MVKSYLLKENGDRSFKNIMLYIGVIKIQIYYNGGKLILLNFLF